MKITVTPPVGEAATRVASAKQLLQETIAELQTASDETTTLKKTIAEVDKARTVAAAQADRDVEAATRMLGLDAQLQRLRPQLSQRERALPNLLDVAAHRIGHVRQETIQPLFGNEMVAILRAEVGSRLLPFYRTSLEARHQANGTISMMMIHGFLQRRAPGIPDAETAERELLATIAELDSILAGKPLVDVTANGQ